MNGIRFDHVSKHYGDVLAVDDLSLTIEPGTTVALLGPNGAGKSTSINLLLGLLRPSRGTIAVNGRAPARAVAAGEVGAMLQDGALIPELTVKETVDLVRGLYPRPLALDEVLSLADLTGLAGRRANKLSGGQTQRVRFALAIAGAPRGRAAGGRGARRGPAGGHAAARAARRPVRVGRARGHHQRRTPRAGPAVRDQDDVRGRHRHP
ncbi:ATP-binding cassette domain-containing protein [Nonomuraea rubra]|uniref:ABC-type multidrug transport system ATPase subunit n=1 Tax=Nonomuraea rubra TaxID=46180 RepID=A0A7X0NSX9_9ACTN|nr:ABC transporter ATP-binding protein [Nonomuraea rubra]MBB6549005.1 ABC-type multidrug transport system ATPase subunit [Nonomuraea rubra]